MILSLLMNFVNKKGDVKKMKRSSFISAAIVAAALLLSSPTFACRPLTTEDYGVADRGTWQLESGVTLVTNRDNSGTNTIDECLHYGVWDHVEAALEMTYLGLNSKHLSQSGLGDGTFHIKWNFLQLSDEEGMSLKFSYQIKSGDANKGLGSNENDLTTLLVLTKKIGDYTLHFNFGYLFDDEPAGQPQDDSIIYNIAAQRSLTDKLTIYTELTSSIPTLYTEDVDESTGEITLERESAIQGLIGISYAINDSLVWDAGIGGGLNKYSPDSSFTTGLTANF